MNVPTCPICNKHMVKNGKTKAGTQRWKCKRCNFTKTNKIDNTAKRLDCFLRWLLSKQRQIDMPSQGRTFRNKTSEFWKIWPLPNIVDEIHKVIYVDGIYIARNLVVLIAASDKYVLGWYLARSENSKSWEALISRIAPPEMVVSDGGAGFDKARKKVWPQTDLQRCTFHASRQVKRYTTNRPNLQAGVELYGIADRLPRIKEKQQAQEWIADYLSWCYKWNDFLSEVTIFPDHSELTHYRLVKARNSLNTLLNKGYLFTYLDDLLTLEGPMPATNNRIEGGVNAPLRQLLFEHRGMSTLRRVKAVYWWCYMHTECPLSAAEILKVMPTDEDIEKIYKDFTYQEKTYETIPQWGDAIVWGEFHKSDSWRHDWD